MKVEELEPGDVLLFSGDDKIVSEAIMWLTDSKVSHAALSYKDITQFVEEVKSGIRISNWSKVKKKLKKRTVYVMRFEDIETGAVLDAATKYLNDKEPYPPPDLILLAILLLYKKFTPSNLTQKVIIKYLRKLTSGLIDFINKHLYPGKKPMFCSQLVYQCYKDGGHMLQIKGGVLLKAAAARGKLPESILDQVADQVRSDTAFKTAILLPDGKPARLAVAPPQSDEELVAELLAALKEDKGEPAELDRDFVMSVHEFSHALYTYHSGTREMLMAPAHPTAGLDFLKENEAYFVTPEDLLDHCTDLVRKGTIKKADL